MEVYRIVSEKFANKLQASGLANRWNKKGQMVIYAGSSRSLSTLELIAHRSGILLNHSYKVIIIRIQSKEGLIKEIKKEHLPTNWRSMDALASLQSVGSKWYQQKESLVLKVPSVIIPQEYNYVIHTEHPAFKSSVRLVGKEDFLFDQRIL